MELKSKRFTVVPAKALKMVMGIAGGQTVKYVSLWLFKERKQFSGIGSVLRCKNLILPCPFNDRASMGDKLFRLNDFQKSLERQSGVIFKCEPDLIIEDDTKVVTDLKVQNDK